MNGSGMENQCEGCMSKVVVSVTNPDKNKNSYCETGTKVGTLYQAVPEALISDHLVINDVIPNTRWSHMTLSHVYTGKEPDSPVFNPEAIHKELVPNNPDYACLTMRQLPNWLRNPDTFKNSQISSISFAFEDQDGSIAHRLTGSTLTAFRNLRCTIKAWVTKKSSKEDWNPSREPRRRLPNDN